tara:strand:+ start:15728 stop:16501 length:774 start_codon:yes stop_codon:yes gene_type:complete
MKVVILAGGKGTRISEETSIIPKPMVRVGNKPLIVHIMEHYSYFGFNEFIIALGYKEDVIKNYFLNFFNLNSDFEINLSTNKIKILDKQKLNWKIKLINTGNNSNTGGRLIHLKKFIKENEFMLTYGDGLSNVNLKKLVSFHKKHKKLATVTIVRPEARFGYIKTNKNNKVTSFIEKPRVDEGFINGGFFVFNKKILDYIKDEKTVLEKEPLERLTKENNLYSYKHTDFWQCMDNIRDKNYLESLSNLDPVPWKDYK